MSLLYGNFANKTEITQEYAFEGLIFNNSHIKNSPKKALFLPAKTLESLCYYWMFAGCSSLNSVKCLATDISADLCLEDWLYGVASTGTFEKAASMTGWEQNSTSGIPSGWTVQDAN